MSEMGRVGADITNNGGRPNGHTPTDRTSTRKELAKKFILYLDFLADIKYTEFVADRK